MDLAIVKWLADLVLRAFDVVSGRRRAFIAQRIGPIEDYLNAEYATLDLLQDKFDSHHEQALTEQDIDQSRALFLAMAIEVAHLRHDAFAMAHAIGDNRLSQSLDGTQQMLLVLSTFSQVVMPGVGGRKAYFDTVSDTIASVTKVRERIRDLIG